MNARSFGMFCIIRLIGNNDVKLHLPESMKNYPVLHVKHTNPHYIQPYDIYQHQNTTTLTVPKLPATELILVSGIVDHTKIGDDHESLSLEEGLPRYEAVWQVTVDFSNPGETITEASYNSIRKQKYIRKDKFVRHLH